MSGNNLERLSTEELKKKEKNTKTLIVIMSISLIGLLYFGVRDYLSNHDMAPVTIISICTLGGLISLFPGLKSIRKELQKRGL